MEMSHLALVADNTPPPPPARPKYLYRQAIRDGICQKCGTSQGVRTVGSRRCGDLHWIRLALCPACTELAREQGYPVMS